LDLHNFSFIHYLLYSVLQAQKLKFPLQSSLHLFTVYVNELQKANVG